MQQKMIDFLIENWAIISPIVFELAVRLIPTGKNLSLVENVLKIIGKLISIIPNNKVGGGIHVLIFVLLSLCSFAQNNTTAKTVYSTNVSDTAFAQTTRTNLQNVNGNTGGIYFDKTRNKWKIWVGTCPTCVQDSAWVDLPLYASSGFTVSPPLYKTGSNVTIQQSTTSQNGYLSNTDWNTFNNKEVSLTFNSGLTRTLNTVKLGGTFLSNTLINMGGFDYSMLGVNSETISKRISNPSNTKFSEFDMNNNSLGLINSSNGIGESQLSLTGASANFFAGTVGLSDFVQIKINYPTNAAYVYSSVAGFKGFSEGSDYSANYTNLSYTNKLYADSHLTGLTFSNSVSSGNVPVFNGTNFTWQTPASSSPAGSNTQIQFNNGGSFGASSDLTFNSSTLTVGANVATGSFNVVSGASNWTKTGSNGIHVDFDQLYSDGGAGNSKIIFDATGINNSRTTGNILIDNSNSNGGQIILKPRSATGFIVFQNLPTTCAGAPSGALANVAGVLTICP